MKQYWFYGTTLDSTIPENNLTQEQIKIIEFENKKINHENFDQFWIGFKRNDNEWNFLRHGFEIIHIKETKPNIARQKLQFFLRKRFIF